MPHLKWRSFKVLNCSTYFSSSAVSKQMEIEVSGISKILLKPGSKTEFGRGSGIVSDDRTVSRHHVSFEAPLSTSDVPKVRFEVIGRNPIWVLCSKNGKVNSFTPTQIGELEAGDKFCVSAKSPNWFTLRKAEFGGQIEDKCEKRQDFDEKLVGLCELIDGEDLELESVDVSSIDPVKEFGFLVLGHEFDRYPKKMIRDMKDWDWFIEDPVIENDDDDEYEKRKKIRRGKRKKGDENDDEWTVESEEDTEQISKVQKVSKPKYTTRSKDGGKRGKEEAGKDLHLKQKSRATNHNVKDDDEEDDTDDETLGGFIIDDELENDEETDDDEDEEEFEEEDDEDE